MADHLEDFQQMAKLIWSLESKPLPISPNEFVPRLESVVKSNVLALKVLDDTYPSCIHHIGYVILPDLQRFSTDFNIEILEGDFVAIN